MGYRFKPEIMAEGIGALDLLKGYDCGSFTP
jgi:hypothetical protein